MPLVSNFRLQTARNKAVKLGGLVEQLAAVSALESPGYYTERCREIGVLREQLAEGLKSLGWEVVSSVANFLLCHLPENGLNVAQVVAACRRHGLFLRDASAIGKYLDTDAIRLEVKDTKTNLRILEILKRVFQG